MNNIININKEELEQLLKFKTIFTIPEAAKITRKSEEQIRRYVREGKLKVYKEWKSYYIEENDLRDYMLIGNNIQIEILKFVEFEYQHQVKFYASYEDLTFRGAIKVLISILNDFKIPLKESVISEMKSMYSY